MTDSEKLYHKIATEIPEVTEGKMFGALCYKTPNGKSAVMYWKGDMVFKLEEKDAEEVMKLKGVKIFEPAKGKKMGGWYQVPETHSKLWKKLAVKAVNVVKKIKK
jgi:hypothetical protein